MQISKLDNNTNKFGPKRVTTSKPSLVVIMKCSERIEIPVVFVCVYFLKRLEEVD